jgi:hypothetical protein
MGTCTERSRSIGQWATGGLVKVALKHPQEPQKPRIDLGNVQQEGNRELPVSFLVKSEGLSPPRS